MEFSRIPQLAVVPVGASLVIAAKGIYQAGQIAFGVYNLSRALFNFFSGRSKKKKKDEAEDKRNRERSERKAKQVLDTVHGTFTSTVFDIPPGTEADQRIVVGEVETNGIPIIIGTRGPYLIRTFVVAGHEIEDFISLHLNNNEVVVGRDGYATNAPFFKPAGTAINDVAEVVKFGAEVDPAENQGSRFLNTPTELLVDGVTKTLNSNQLIKYKQEPRRFLRVSTHNGALPIEQPITFRAPNDPHPDVILRSRFNLPLAFQILGHAYVTLEQYKGPYLARRTNDNGLSVSQALDLTDSRAAQQARELAQENNAVFGSRPGNPRLRIRGGKPWDPRDPTQNINNFRTWKYTNNAALVAAYVIQHRLFSNNDITYNDFDIPALIKAANICDEFLIDENNIKIRKYTINGIIQTSEDPYRVIDDMMLAMNARLVYRQNKYHIIISQPVKTIDTISDQDLVDDDFSYSPFLKDSEQYNKIRVNFQDLSPTGLGRQTEAPTVNINIPSVTTNNTNNLNLKYVSNPTRAQFIASIYAKAQKYQKSLSLPINLKALRYSVGDVIRVDSEINSQWNATYQIANITSEFSNKTIRLGLTEFDNEIFAPSKEVQMKPYLKTVLDVDQPRVSVASNIVNQIVNLPQFQP